jgi:hypothetical protein
VNRLVCVILGLALASIAACAPTLAAQSPAPPGRSARLDEINGFWGTKGYRLELSQGVAIAVTCYQGGPCEKLAVISDDSKIAEVHAASLGALQPNGFAGQASAAAVVVVGKAPGTTKLHVRTKHGTREIAVTIIAAPEPAAPATVAR